jgi:hypothetical protein
MYRLDNWVMDEQGLKILAGVIKFEVHDERFVIFLNATRDDCCTAV